MLKKIQKIIKIRKLYENEEIKNKVKEKIESEYLVWFSGDTCKEVYNKDDLLTLIENDNNKRIRYIFDMADRIIVDRNIKVEDIKNE